MKGRNAGELVCLRNHPEFLSTASAWFGSKWDVPVEAYEESMKECMERKTGIPQWYVVMNGQGAIIAGAGVIENDFHDRKDLTPNLCALFVEKGIEAGAWPRPSWTLCGRIWPRSDIPGSIW